MSSRAEIAPPIIYSISTCSKYSLYLSGLASQRGSAIALFSRPFKLRALLQSGNATFIRVPRRFNKRNFTVIDCSDKKRRNRKTRAGDPPPQEDPDGQQLSCIYLFSLALSFFFFFFIHVCLRKGGFSVSPQIRADRPKQTRTD